MKPLLFTRHSWLVLLGGMLVAACAEAADPAASPTLVPSQDGASIIDLRARLVWPRCVQGMLWNGKACTGTPQRLDYAQAVALAHARWKTDGVRWRLPRVPELKRLVDKTARPPGPSSVLFSWHAARLALVRFRQCADEAGQSVQLWQCHERRSRRGGWQHGFSPGLGGEHANR
jgi:Protein of unknown function (DUF1566).